MKIVIAGNSTEYYKYLQETNQSPQDARYVNSEEELRGLDIVEVVRYGKWWMNPVSNSFYLGAIEKKNWIKNEN